MSRLAYLTRDLAGEEEIGVPAVNVPLPADCVVEPAVGVLVPQARTTRPFIAYWKSEARETGIQSFVIEVIRDCLPVPVLHAVPSDVPCFTAYFEPEALGKTPAEYRLNLPQRISIVGLEVDLREGAVLGHVGDLPPGGIVHKEVSVDRQRQSVGEVIARVEVQMMIVPGLGHT